MPEQVTKKFMVLREMRKPPIEIEARNFRDLAKTAKDRIRTETIRQLREGKSFYIDSERSPDYHEKMHNFSRINVAIEAFEDVIAADGDSSCYLHVLTHDNAHLSFGIVPQGTTRRRMAAMLNDWIAEGTVLIISGANAHADSSK